MTPRPGFFARLTAAEGPPPWGLLTALLTVLGAFLAVLAVSIFIGVWAGEQTGTPLIAWAVGMVVVTLFVLQTRRADREALRFQPPRIVLPLLIALNLALAMVLDLVSLVAAGRLLPRLELALLGAPSVGVGLIAAILLMVILQPLAEELVFRGVALPALRAALGPLPGILICAILYGVFHLLVYTPGYTNVPPSANLWYGFALPALDGLVFSVTRTVTGSTRAAIVAHATFGLFAILKLALVAG